MPKISNTFATFIRFSISELFTQGLFVKRIFTLGSPIKDNIYKQFV